jgi:HEAT repeat protein
LRVNGRLATPADMPALADLIGRLHDDDAGVRALAVLAIGRLAADSQPAEQEAAIAGMISALADEHVCVRQAAAIALGKLGLNASAALPALREMAAEKATPGPPGRRLPH